MKEQKKRKFDFITGIKYLFYFIIIVAHFQMLRGTIEVLPLLLPPFANQSEATVIERYTKTNRSSNTTSRYSNHYSTSYFIETKYTVAGEEYINKDLVSEEVYDNTRVDDKVKIAHLKGFPSIGMIEKNKEHGLKNHLLLASILIGIDVLIWLIWRWIKRTRAKKK